MFFINAFGTTVGDYSFDDFSTADYYEIGLVVLHNDRGQHGVYELYHRSCKSEL